MTPRELPIPFMNRLVPSVMDGTKLVTRRIVRHQPQGWPGGWPGGLQYGVDGPGTARVVDADYPDHPDHDLIKCPFGKPGDLLWVRESHAFHRTWDLRPPRAIPYHSHDRVWYRADGSCGDGCGRWRPPMFMLKAIARTWLEHTELRVEQIQNISEEDCIAEGCAGVVCQHGFGGWGEGPGVALACEDCMNTGWLEPPTEQFRDLWNEANGRRGYGWSRNPWVWVIRYQKVDHIVLQHRTEVRDESGE